MAYSMSESDVKSAANRVGADISNAVTNASEKVGETVGAVQTAATQNYDKFEAAIRRNPLAAASIAGGVGFVLAVLARR